MIITCLMGDAVGILSTALSGSDCAWASVPRPRIDATNIEAEKRAFACQLLVLLRCIRSPRLKSIERSLAAVHDIFISRPSRLSEILVILRAHLALRF